MLLNKNTFLQFFLLELSDTKILLLKNGMKALRTTVFGKLHGLLDIKKILAFQGTAFPYHLLLFGCLGS